MPHEDFDRSSASTARVEHPRRHSVVLTVLVILATCVFGFGTIGAVIWKLASTGERNRAVVASVLPRDPTEERDEAIGVFSNYDARPGGANAADAVLDEEQAAISELLRQLEASTTGEDVEAFRAVFDADRFVRQIEQTGALDGFSSFDRRTVRSEVLAGIDPESTWARLLLAGVTAPPGDPDSRVVYVIGYSGPEDEELVHRFWIGKVEGAWKLYDWERLDLGLSEAQRWSLHCRYQNTPEIEALVSWAHLVNEANELNDAGEREQAIEKMQQAELSLGPAECHDYQRLLTGYNWVSLNEVDRAFACYDQIQDPINAPGLYFSRAALRRFDKPLDSLRDAEMCEEAVGPSPDLLRLKARILGDLDRNPEALVEWQRLLRMAPKDEEALAKWLLASSASGQAEFAAYVSGLSEPMTTIAAVAQQVRYEDFKALESLVALAEQTAPNSEGALYIAGLAAETDGRTATAAELYWQALEQASDEETRVRDYDAYLNAMVTEGRVLEALEGAPDFGGSVEELLYGYDEGGNGMSEDEYKEVVALYASREPESLDALERAANLAIQERRFGDAEAMLRRALAQMDAVSEPEEADEYRHTSLSYSLARAMYELGRWREAYDELTPPRERFAELWSLARDDGRWDLVVEMLALHRGREPADPEIAFVEGELAAHDRNWDEALESMQRAVEAADEDQKWRFTDRLADVCVNSDRWLEHYGRRDDPDAAFSEIAAELSYREDWGSLEQLIAAHRQRRPDDVAALRKYEAEIAWARQQYDRYVALADEALAPFAKDSLETYEATALERNRFRALLHLGNVERAREVALESKREGNDSSQLAVVEAVAGDTEAAAQSAIAAARQNEAWSFYQFDDFGALFLAPRYRALQEEHPAEPPYRLHSTIAILLLDEPRPFELKDIGAISEDPDAGGPHVTLQPLADGSTALFVQLEGASIWLHAGVGPYRGNWRLVDDAGPLAEAVDNSQGWIAVGAAGWNTAGRERAEGLARRLARKLAGDAVPVIYAGDTAHVPYFAAYPGSEAVLDVWAATGDLKRFDESQQALNSSPRPQSIEEDRQFVRRLWDAVHAYESVPGTRLTVGGALGHADVETIKIAVSAIRRKYGLQFDGLLVEAPVLVPELQAGLPMRLDEYFVEAFQINDEPPVFRHEPFLFSQ